MEGIREELKTVQKLLDKQKLIEEWPRLKEMFNGAYKNLKLEHVCKRVISLHSDMTEFSKLCKIALCIAVTSVECERSFSTQNCLKNKYRSSIKSENLDILI